jgi:diaminopimelate epimerase
MSGAGNDFIVIDNRQGLIRNGQKLAQTLCNRRWGVGADGLILIEKSLKADFKMNYYNADGSSGGMCGNGGRCAALFCFLSGFTGAFSQFEAVNHIYKAEVNDNHVNLYMKDPKRIRAMVLATSIGKLHANFIDTGAPHVVIHSTELKSISTKLSNIPVDSIGREIRFHRVFGTKGVNVDFFETKTPDLLRMRTYERGVEGETLACGTGAVACAIIGSLKHGLTPPVKVRTTGKKSLEVNFEIQKSGIKRVRLRGPAEVIFEGKIKI